MPERSPFPDELQRPGFETAGQHISICRDGGTPACMVGVEVGNRSRHANDNDTLRAGTRSWALPNPRRTNRPLTVLAARLTLIHEEGRAGRCPRVLTDER